MNDAKLEWVKAMAAVQAEVGAIEKDQQNPFGKYKYADLAGYLKATKPALAKHEMMIVQTLQTEKMEDAFAANAKVLVTEVYHVPTGHCERFMVDLGNPEHKGMSEEQAFGSAMTYYRKYQLAGICNTVHSEDPDALAPPEQDAPLPSGSTEDADWKEELRAFVNWLETARDYRKVVNATKVWNDALHGLKEFGNEHAVSALTELKKRFEARKKVIGPKTGTQGAKEALNGK